MISECVLARLAKSLLTIVPVPCLALPWAIGVEEVNLSLLEDVMATRDIEVGCVFCR